MDDADISGPKMEIIDNAAIDEVRRKAAAIPVGRPGECDLCGEESGRLVRGVCARCRDLHKLP
jgi:hypothetical protein